MNSLFRVIDNCKRNSIRNVIDAYPIFEYKDTNEYKYIDMNQIEHDMKGSDSSTYKSSVNSTPSHHTDIDDKRRVDMNILITLSMLTLVDEHVAVDLLAFGSSTVNNHQNQNRDNNPNDYSYQINYNTESNMSKSNSRDSHMDSADDDVNVHTDNQSNHKRFNAVNNVNNINELSKHDISSYEEAYVYIDNGIRNKNRILREKQVKNMNSAHVVIIIDVSVSAFFSNYDT